MPADGARPGRLAGRVAIIHGGGGAIGGAVARAFAQDGARVFLAGRTAASLERVALGLRAAGFEADVAVVDALDEQAVDAHADEVATRAGGIDIALNAVGFAHVQGPPLAELALDAFLHPIVAYARTNFLTARAAARHMRARGRGVILTLSTPGARMSGTGFLGNGTSSAGVEGFSRLLAGELGGDGIRVVCLRPHAIPEALAVSHTRTVFEGFARRLGTTVDAMVAERARHGTLLGRFPTLDQVAAVAAFAASDGAGAMTGAIANLTCGSLVD